MSGSAPTQRGGQCFAQLATAAILLIAAMVSQLALGNPMPGIVAGVVVAFLYWMWVFWRQSRG